MNELIVKTWGQILDEEGGEEAMIKNWATNRGILKPEDNLDKFLPKKQPLVDTLGIIIFNDAGSEYFITWHQINTPTACLMFIHHLSEKIWMNRRIIQFIIEETAARYNWGYLGTTDSKY